MSARTRSDSRSLAKGRPGYEYPGTRITVTGATGFIGAHVARLLAERGAEVRVTHRDPARLSRLGETPVTPVEADVLDRAALRRAFRGSRLVFHGAGMVATRPAEMVWKVNALSPRLAVEAAAAEGVERVVLTSSVGGVGPAAAGRAGREEDVYRGGGLGLTYVDSKHEGESEALAAAARCGIELVVVNPSYVLGVPVNRFEPGETSTRIVGNYLRGRLPAIVDSATNIVHVEDAALGHLLAAESGKPGERYILGGENVRWLDLIELVAELSGIRHPVLVIPREIAEALAAAGTLSGGIVISPEAFALMAQDWRYSSEKAKRELDYRPRGLKPTVRETVEWYVDLMRSGVLDGGRPSVMSLGSLGMRVAARAGGVRVARAVEQWTGRRFVAAG
jgi:dihydroflavonol-4-reductase